MTLGETLTFIHARNKANDFTQRQTGELIRWHGWLLLQVMGSKKNKLQPKDLFKFPDEVDNKPTRSHDSEEAKRIFEKMQQIINKKIALK